MFRLLMLYWRAVSPTVLAAKRFTDAARPKGNFFVATEYATRRQLTPPPSRDAVSSSGVGKKLRS
jgi:hypothetical protein